MRPAETENDYFQVMEEGQQITRSPWERVLKWKWKKSASFHN